MNGLMPPDSFNPEMAGAALLHEYLRVSPDLHAVTYRPQPEQPMVSTAILKKAFGAAPYVGDPFVYIWYIAVDRGHQVASTPAVIHRMPRDWTQV